MKKNFIYVRRVATMILMAVVITITGCHKDTPIDRPYHLVSDKCVDEVVLLFENDVHGVIDGYPMFAGYRDAVADTFEYVVTVSCGDCLSGPFAAFYQGESIIDIMKSVGYDYFVPGNHDFDSSMDTFLNFPDATKVQPLCCNFNDRATGKPLFKEYEVKDYGGIKVGYVGVTTPEMEDLVTISALIDETGNYIYDFGREDVVEKVQNAVDAAKAEGAQTVVLLSHIGDVMLPGIISKTSDIDVVLDAHKHTTEPGAYFKDKDGNDVLWTSTGTQLKNIGRVSITRDGKVKSSLIAIETVSQRSETVGNVVDGYNQDFEKRTKKVIGHSDAYLTENDANGKYIARLKECPIGNFCADAFRAVTGAQIGIVNAGGMRTEIQAGDITYASLLAVFPFMNEVSTIKVSGRALKNALEMSYAHIDDFGGFYQISGMKVLIDSTATEGNRVKSVKVDVAGNGTFVDISDNEKYTIGGSSHVLLEGGNGIIFENSERLPLDGYLTDDQLLLHYVTKTLGGYIPESAGKVDGRISFVE